MTIGTRPKNLASQQSRRHLLRRSHREPANRRAWARKSAKDRAEAKSLLKAGTNDTMNSIAIYSDLICPWCYIGKRRMEEAVRQLPAETQVSRSWHPFQLNPEMPRAGVNRKMYRSKKFGSWERSQAMDAQLVRLAPARQAGGNFRRARRRGRGFVPRLLLRRSQLRRSAEAD